MKIVNKRTKGKAPSICDLAVGDVFTRDETWGERVFMVIWNDKITSRVAFTCLGPNDTGQTWNIARTGKPGENICLLYKKAEVRTGLPS